MWPLNFIIAVWSDRGGPGPLAPRLNPRLVPGRSFNTTRCCLLGCNETETLPHVLGFCRKGEQLWNNRHNRVRTFLANGLSKLGWDVFEEIPCVSDDGSNRWADIIAINRNCQKAMILDPTVLFETNYQQAIQVDEEKRSIYEPCIPYFSVKYNIPVEKWSVIGLLFGARGSLPKFTYTTLQHLGFHFSYIQQFLWELWKPL